MRRFKGSIIVISAPSGAGKTTLIDRLRASDRSLAFSVSYTTRPRRRGEHNGREYYFVTREDFRHMVRNGGFAEWAKVHAELYGTPLRPLRTAQRHGRDVVLDIDIQGYRRLKRCFPEAVGIFVVPPSFRELKRRLNTRRQDRPDSIRQRLKDARQEMAAWSEYDYVLINRNLEEAFSSLRAIVTAIRHRPEALRIQMQDILKKFGG